MSGMISSQASAMEEIQQDSNPQPEGDEADAFVMPVAEPTALPSTNENRSGNDENQSSSTSGLNDGLGPTGEWSTSICECWTQIISGLFWMACCCTPCLYGQLMTRSRLNACGKPMRDTSIPVSGNACGLMFGIGVCIWILHLGFFNPFYYAPFVVFVVFAGTRTRNHLRRLFSIPTSMPLRSRPANAPADEIDEGYCEDCLYTCFCPCCSSVQMALHTHDPIRNPYMCVSSTGLPTYSSVLPVDPITRVTSSVTAGDVELSLQNRSHVV